MSARQSVEFPRSVAFGEYTWYEEFPRGARYPITGPVVVPDNYHMRLTLWEGAVGNVAKVRQSRPGLLNRVEADSLSLEPTDLLAIARFHGLRSLSLTKVEADDAIVEKLCMSLPTLEFLSLIGCPITQAAIYHVGTLISMQRLFLNGARVSNIDPLAKLTNLITLGLKKATIDDSAGRAIGQMVALTKLNLVGTPVTNAILKDLAKLKSLKSLALTLTSIGDEDLFQLATLPDLKTLDLGGTNVTTDGLRQLKNAHALRHLYMNDTQLDEDAVPILSEMTWLEHLAFDGTKISDDGEIAVRRALSHAVINGVHKLV